MKASVLARASTFRILSFFNLQLEQEKVKSHLMHDCLSPGLRMGKPNTCNQEVYDIMLTCWAAEPHTRPAFTDLEVTLAASTWPEEERFSAFGFGVEEDSPFPGATSGWSRVSEYEYQDSEQGSGRAGSQLSVYEYQDSVATSLSMANGAKGVSSPAEVGQGGNNGASPWHGVHTACADAVLVACVLRFAFARTTCFLLFLVSFLTAGRPN